MNPPNPQLAAMIDHTYLKADADENIIKKICSEALEWNFASVCIPPSFVPLATHSLTDSTVAVCTVIGFPLGYNQTSTKVHEATLALEEGAREIDMVINLAALKSGDWNRVKNDITAVRKVRAGFVLTVILEACYL